MTAACFHLLERRTSFAAGAVVETDGVLFVQVPSAIAYSNVDCNYDGVIDEGDYGIIDHTYPVGSPFPT
jgi:hypothetical protein